MDGCDVGAIFTVPDSMLPKAQKTGNFTLIPNKVAREVVDNEAKVRAVSLVDTVTRTEQEIQARAVAVCCGAIESPRPLLNSRSPRFPNGLANSSDAVGRHLSGHVTAGVFGYLEELVGAPNMNNDGATDHSYIPRFNLNRKPLDYAGGVPVSTPGHVFHVPISCALVQGLRRCLQKAGAPPSARFRLDGLLWEGAGPENRITADPAHTDDYGIPVPVVHFRFGENDRAVWKDMKQNAEEILGAAKCRLLVNDNPEPTGFASHETGTVRMGNDPRSSGLNRCCQAHDAKNLLVVDGSCFTTFPEKNHTLTIMALAVRAAAYITREAKSGSLR
jgi:choline dehydrogenase-like flavoprotein